MVQSEIGANSQIIDATLVRAPKQHFDREEKHVIDQNAVPADWTPARNPSGRANSI